MEAFPRHPALLLHPKNTLYEMANGTRAKIDRLRLVLGDEFPEPLPSPEPAAPSASANVVSDASEMGICVQEHDPTPKVVVEGSQNDR